MRDIDEPLPEGLDLTLDDGPGPARRLAPAQSAAMIAGALDAWQGTLPASAAPPARAAASRLPWMIAAASLLVAVTSVAAMTVVLTREPEPEPERTLPVEVPQAQSDPEPTPEPDSEPVSASDSASDSVSASASDSVSASDSDSASDSTSRPAVARRRSTPSPRTPDDLLAEANAHRAARRWREAEATYARVPREHPGSFSAYVAQVAAADVRLAHLRDPRGALRLYRAALAARPGGPLDAEAREGIARALRRVGDEEGEREALRALVAAHPSTPAAARARARLEELGSSSR